VPDKERQERRCSFVPDKGAQKKRPCFVPNQKQRDKAKKAKKKNIFGQIQLLHRERETTAEPPCD
jgi:hypothetical protein